MQKENTKPTQEQQRALALQKADLEYYDRLSVHHGDNERYSLAVKTINEYYDGLKLKQKGGDV